MPTDAEPIYTKPPREKLVPEDAEFELLPPKVQALVRARCSLLRSHLGTQPEGWGITLARMSTVELLAEMTRLGVPPWEEVAARHAERLASD